MKLCGVCKGEGYVNFEVCETCDGEGIDNRGTFTVGKIQRRRSAEYEVEQKKIKFDKKNASRSL
ncbi:hypothetical protein M5X02_20305 [Paenibacillus alvei]|uniref:hypothetical protein n=1 Tax=Paenibacillus alvei TaxID=44250 RepID=UPI000289B428|nr:hypothetical protein [Paenibacillus alvei]EJW13933.1 hypothetical protein PAV_141p00390 [Paenibacillus alvei DSM 29]MCY9542991.1 hypothetical protein [Paenibacillus alvei]MCY9707703.1 hypothetical protein [Paenibacillus alvei]MEC0082784.1 hypothetical protein [Paenibacillus alvei]